MKQKERTQYLAIPLVIADDIRLYDGAKVLYGRINALCRKEGFCWARNEYFANQHQKDIKTISRWLQNLEENGYIKTDTMYADERRKCGERCISVLNVEDGQKCPKNGQDYPEFGQKCPETRANMSQNTDKKVQSYTLYNKVKKEVMNKREGIAKKSAFGFYKNVFLSPSEHENLKHDFSAICDQIIEELSGYMQSQHKTYEDHAATVRLWCSRKADELKNKTSSRTQKGKINTPASYDINSIEKESFTETLNFGGAL